jgi:hypothetical protein
MKDVFITQELPSEEVTAIFSSDDYKAMNKPVDTILPEGELALGDDISYQRELGY